MSLIKSDLRCPPGKLLIEKKYRHRFRLEERLECDGDPCVRASPLDKGFEKDSTVIWPEAWVYFPGQQMDLFPEAPSSQP